MAITAEGTGSRADWAFLVRSLAVADARRALAEAISDRGAAQAALDEAGRAVLRARQRATRASGDEEVESFAAWLPQARRAGRDAAVHLQQAEFGAAVARAALRLAHAGLASATEGFDANNPPQSADNVRPGLDGQGGAS